MMRKVQIVRPTEVDVKPLDPHAFLFKSSGVGLEPRINNPKVEQLAKKLRLPYTQKQIDFTVTIINAYNKR
jgi:hypothetical protein